MNIQELKQLISSFQEGDFKQASSELITHLQIKENLELLLISIMDNSFELERISKRSFLHNLGFSKISLIGWDISQFMVKLHLWNTNDTISIDDDLLSVHDHFYDFRSLILKGQLDFKIFNEAKTGNNKFLKYKNPHSSSKYQFLFQEEVALKELLDISLYEGGGYFMQNDTIHLAKVKPKLFTSSLCIQSCKKKDYTNIYSKFPLLSEQKSTQYSEKDIKNIIELLLSTL